MARDYQSVQALRGVASLVVVLFHVNGLDFHSFSWVSLHPLRSFGSFGYAGVDLFFVLSGFIIATTSRPNLGRPSRLLPFLFRRAWRIYPPFWVVLAVGAGIMAWLNPTFFPSGGWAVLARTAVLLPIAGPVELLPVAWTLTYEMMFYLAFAGLFLLPRRIGPTLLAVWAAVVIWGIAAGAKPVNVFAAHAVSPYVLEFLLGCAVAWLPAWPRGRTAIGVAVAAGIWTALGLLLTPDLSVNGLGANAARRAAIFGVGSALLLLAGVGYERGGGHIALPKLVALGNASYSLYLTHYHVILTIYILSMFARLGHSRFWHVLWLAGICITCVAVGLAFHRWVERPLLKLTKSKKRTPPPDAPGLLIPISLTARRG